MCLELDRFESSCIHTTDTLSFHPCGIGQYESRGCASRSSTGPRVSDWVASACGGSLDRRATLSSDKPAPSGKRANRALLVPAVFGTGLFERRDTRTCGLAAFNILYRRHSGDLRHCLWRDGHVEGSSVRAALTSWRFELFYRP